MSSSEPKPEPLFAEPIDDPSVTPDGYDPTLKYTVVDRLQASQMYGGTMQLGSPEARAAVAPEVAGEEGSADALFAASATLQGEDPLATGQFVETLPNDDKSMAEALAETELPVGEDGQVALPDQARRTTVLPKAILKGEAPSLHMIPRERYEQLKDLGEGAAGDVVLARDNDIQRLVALKRLKKQHHVPASLARFVEEIQTVGQLEHPHIVPIHDVGVDDDGLYYFVMKYVEGETMAEIIERLRMGDTETHAQYTFAVRNQIFLKILQAVRFAHNYGIIHRDLKPENIMVGSCGQVMVMDWGIAKRVPATPDGPYGKESVVPHGQEAMSGAIDEATAAGLPTGEHSAKSMHLPERERLFETQLGTIMGTPAYMPPEQALGKVDQVDVRSDIYSLTALYYEWMTLKHYLGHKTSLKELLWGILQEEPVFAPMVENKYQAAVPAEFGYFTAKGLRKEPAERYQSIGEMEHYLQLAIEGKFGIHCPITLMKRGGNETLRFIDRYPKLALTGMGLGMLLALLGTVQIGFWVLAAVIR